MVVMITPIAFANIKYQTYISKSNDILQLSQNADLIVFAVINAFIVPCVYFFYPETAYRSLEEMDEIFRNSNGIFDVVRVAKPSVTPNRYDRHGKLLINYLETEEHRRRSSVVTPNGMGGAKAPYEDKERSQHNEAYHTENGYANGSGSENEK